MMPRQAVFRGKVDNNMKGVLQRIWEEIATYINTSTAGITFGTHATRVALNPADVPNSFFIETDRNNIGYLSDGHYWYYAFGRMFGTLQPDQKPSDLGSDPFSFNAGFEFQSQDFAHLYIWGNTLSGGDKWEPGPGEEWDIVVHKRTTISSLEVGWHLCDGTTNVRRSKPDGTTELITVPNEISGTYRRSASYDGPTRTAAVVPTFSAGTTSLAGAHFHGVEGSALEAGAHSHEVSGAAASAGAHTHIVLVDEAGAHSHEVTATAADAGSHSHSAGAVAAGAHTHEVEAVAAEVTDHTHGAAAVAGIINADVDAFEPTTEVVGSITGIDVTIDYAGAHFHEVTGTANTSGEHEHDVDVASAGTHGHSVTGSTDETGLHSHDASTEVSGEHGHSVSGSTSENGAHEHLVEGFTSEDGDHTHTVTGTISNTGQPPSMGFYAYLRL